MHETPSLTDSSGSCVESAWSRSGVHVFTGTAIAWDVEAAGRRK